MYILHSKGGIRLYARLLEYVFPDAFDVPAEYPWKW
jgi:hypothetical protein